MTLSCDIDDCDFTTDSKVGLGVHKSRSHDLQKFIDVDCEYCDTGFEKRRSEVERTDTHFCSRDCHFSWKSETNTGKYELLDCDYCDGETKVYPIDLERYENHFCSQKCKDSYHSDNYTGDEHWRYNSGNKTDCDECGNTIFRSPSMSEGVNYCSVECESKNLSQRQSGKSNSNWKETITTNCKHCDSEIECKPGSISRNTFCSKECSAKYKANEWVGENHPAWNGGHADYYGSNWIQRREEALERDDFCCQVCDMTREEHYEEYGKDLDVHHKIPIDEFDEPEDANYLINLVTTCRSCHGQLDTISRREANRKPIISV